MTDDLALTGCTPEPLMAYLKALGVLRLVTKQTNDESVRGWWRDATFWLRAPVLFGTSRTNDEKESSLVAFFVDAYEPTPIIVPWSGSDFFAVNWAPTSAASFKTPTSSRIVESILMTKTARLEPYRKALRACKAALDQCAIDSKKRMERDKWTFIQTLRSTCEDEALVEWIDAAAVTVAEQFATLLGSGGGSDGNTHFSDNFMQNLWDVLPDFADQRKQRRGHSRESASNTSHEQLRHALFAASTNQLIYKRTSSLYDSGAVGGPNATQGMERESLANPWNVILALEGTLSLAGAAAKRLGSNPKAHREAAFPFQVSASVTSGDGLAHQDRTGREIWLPLWSRPASSGEVLALLREGRAHCDPRPVRSGSDMARAIASLGVDRGIAAFQRYIVVKGRVGGSNYNTAASLGPFDVREQRDSSLLREIDPWLERFRSACSAKDARERLAGLVDRVDSVIFDFCKYGGAARFQRIVITLGAAERELAHAERFRSEKKLRPLSGLSPAWLSAADDGSPEFRIAEALASVGDPENKIGPLRANLEPVDWKKKCRAWAERDRALVWNAANLATNLANVVQRRMLDGDRVGCERPPLASRFKAPLEVISLFLGGVVSDERIDDLLWGLILVEPGKRATMQQPHFDQALALSREYALLKLLFLPQSLVPERSGERLRWRLARRLKDGREEPGIAVRPEPRILPLLRSGRTSEACRIAAQRLRISGLPPIAGPAGSTVRDHVWDEPSAHSTDSRRGARLAAALLIPISSRSVSRLVELVCRNHSAAAEALALP